MMRCCICGRQLSAPTLFIGNLPVGSTCGKRAGLVELARKRTGVLRLAAGRLPKLQRDDPQTMDLFQEEPGHG